MEDYINDKIKNLEVEIRNTKSNKEKYLLVKEYLHLLFLVNLLYRKKDYPKISKIYDFYKEYQSNQKISIDSYIYNLDFIYNIALSINNVLCNRSLKNYPVLSYDSENKNVLKSIIKNFYQLFPEEVINSINSVLKKDAYKVLPNMKFGGICLPLVTTGESVVLINDEGNIFNSLSTVHEFGHVWHNTLPNQYGNNYLAINPLAEYPSIFFQTMYIDNLKNCLIKETTLYRLYNKELELIKSYATDTVKNIEKIRNNEIKKENMWDAISQMLYLIGYVLSLNTANVDFPAESFYNMKNILIESEFLNFEKMLDKINIYEAVEVLEGKIVKTIKLYKKLYYSPKVK